jgi:hypothetical protein
MASACSRTWLGYVHMARHCQQGLHAGWQLVAGELLTLAAACLSVAGSGRVKGHTSGRGTSGRIMGGSNKEGQQSVMGQHVHLLPVACMRHMVTHAGMTCNICCCCCCLQNMHSM